MPKAGDRLVAQASIFDAREKQGNAGGKLTFLTMRTQYCTEDGSLRAEQFSTSVTTENAPGGGDWETDLPDYNPDYPVLERESPFAGIQRTGFDKISEGSSPGEVSAGPLFKQDIVRFQGVVGEDDPLHHDMEWANKQEYPSVFALGTHQGSLMAAYASYWLCPENIREYKIRFRNIAWPGNCLVYNGVVIEHSNNDRACTLHLTCKRENGELVSEAWATYDFSS